MTTLALMLFCAPAPQVAAMVLVHSVKFIEDAHEALHHLRDFECDIAMVVNTRVLNVAHRIL